MPDVPLPLCRYKTETETLYYLIAECPIYTEKRANFRAVIMLK